MNNPPKNTGNHGNMICCYSQLTADKRTILTLSYKMNKLVALCALVFLLSGDPYGAHAMVASPWQGSEHARVRLIGVAQTDARADMFYLGIEIALQAGWKTYWRTPGNGIAPRIDWSESENLTIITHYFPAPERLPDQSIGYREHVIFPIKIRVNEPNRRTLVSAKMQFGVCATLCIPAYAHVVIELPNLRQLTYSTPPTRLSEALAAVPQQINNQQVSFGVVEISDHRDQDPPYLELTQVKPSMVVGADLFVEGPEHWYQPLAQKIEQTIAQDSAYIRYHLPLAEAHPPQDERKVTLRLTSVGYTKNAASPTIAAEQTWILNQDN